VGRKTLAQGHRQKIYCVRGQSASPALAPRPTERKPWAPSSAEKWRHGVQPQSRHPDTNQCSTTSLRRGTRAIERRLPAECVCENASAVRNMYLRHSNVVTVQCCIREMKQNAAPTPKNRPGLKVDQSALTIVQQLVETGPIQGKQRRKAGPFGGGKKKPVCPDAPDRVRLQRYGGVFEASNTDSSPLIRPTKAAPVACEWLILHYGLLSQLVLDHLSKGIRHATDVDQPEVTGSLKDCVYRLPQAHCPSAKV